MVPFIVAFNRDVLGVTRDQPKLLTEAEAQWLVKALLEEVSEFHEAHELNSNLPQSVDALLDLIYFAVGGLYRLGLSVDQIMLCFHAVHQANLTKKRGVKDSRPQDGSVADAVKTADFVDPVIHIERILTRG
jgi:predicted HAD superfamily Cof-like phosphohydrolase